MNEVIDQRLQGLVAPAQGIGALRRPGKFKRISRPLPFLKQPVGLINWKLRES